MKYTCTHEVEAWQWLPSDETLKHVVLDWIRNKGQEYFIHAHDNSLELEGGNVMPGDWILWSDDEFYIMDDDLFRDQYKLVE